MDEHTDILITRVLDGRAGAGDWRELEAMAAREPSLWRELALAQRDQALLGEAIEGEMASAYRVRLPEAGVEEAPGAVPARAGWRRRVGSWAGWAVAASVAGLYMGNVPHAGQRGVDDSLLAGIANLNQPATEAMRSFVNDPSPEALRSAYLTLGEHQGTVLREVPAKVLLDVRPLRNGQSEVYFIRQIVERSVVPDLYKFATDEAGRPVPVRVDVDALAPSLPAGVVRGSVQPVRMGL